ncbi:MAG TPA: radical SAM protein [bacterium]
MESTRTTYRLSEDCSVKYLEKPFIYNRKTDELYEIDKEGLNFIGKLPADKSIRHSNDSKKFFNYLLRENLIIETDTVKPIRMPAQAILPSLRYLELQLTAKCNLKCKHCYLGKASNAELPIKIATKAVKEFERMQGLRLIVSGGEPLLYSHFDELNGFLSGSKLRRILLTNGFLLTEIDLGMLNFDEIQVSVDGIGDSHDRIRGKGSFNRTMAGVEAAKKAGFQISIATMVTEYNKNEFSEMERLLKSKSIKEWGIDMPCVSGYLQENSDLMPSLSDAAKCMRFAFDGGYHGTDGKSACGAHLCTITPEGHVLKCGFYPESPYGRVAEGLKNCWLNATHLTLSQLKECRDCQALKECAGGCRYRAETLYGKDKVMCYLYGMKDLLVPDISGNRSILSE